MGMLISDKKYYGENDFFKFEDLGEFFPERNYLFKIPSGGLGVTIYSSGNFYEDENGRYIQYDSILIDTQLWGRAPKWDEVIAALFSCDLGKEIEVEGLIQFKRDYRNNEWVIDIKEGLSGCADYRFCTRLSKEAASRRVILENSKDGLDRVRSERYGLNGKVEAKIHISCNGKLNLGISSMTLGQFYVFLKAIKRPSVSELLDSFKEEPITILSIRDKEWVTGDPVEVFGDVDR